MAYGGIPRDDGASRDDGAIAHRHAWHDERVPTDPHVVADDRVAVARKVELAGPHPAPGLEDRKRKRGDPRRPVIAAVHDELDTGGDRAVSTDAQPIPAEVEVVQDVAQERVGPGRVVVVREFADLDRRGEAGQVADEHHARLVGHRMQSAGIGMAHDSSPRVSGGVQQSAKVAGEPWRRERHFG
jgi:hypothetical protein